MKNVKPRYKKRPISKPQNSLLSDREWAKWIAFFEDSGWGKTEHDIADSDSPLHQWLILKAKTHKKDVTQKICLICGEQISLRTKYYASYGICKDCYNAIKNSHFCKPKAMWKVDLAESPCSECGRYGIYDLKKFRCKSCYNADIRKANSIPVQKRRCRRSNYSINKDTMTAISNDLQKNKNLYEGLLVRKDFGFGIN